MRLSTTGRRLRSKSGLSESPSSISHPSADTEGQAQWQFQQGPGLLSSAFYGHALGTELLKPSRLSFLFHRTEAIPARPLRSRWNVCVINALRTLPFLPRVALETVSAASLLSDKPLRHEPTARAPSPRGPSCPQFLFSQGPLSSDPCCSSHSEPNAFCRTYFFI